MDRPRGNAFGVGGDKSSECSAAPTAIQLFTETCLGEPSFLLKESAPQARRVDQSRFERENGKII
jgi:hypothetical protein